MLGKTTSKVGADAAARIGSLSGGHNMMPWALLRGDTNCLDAVTGKPIFGDGRDWWMARGAGLRR